MTPPQPSPALRRHHIAEVKFRRQHPLGFYIADFYCPEAKMVVEVDGPIHIRKVNKEHDDNRTAEMDRMGIKVIRFTNNEIEHQIVWVVDSIKKEILERLIHQTI
jgi:very-short-patch-repair endonuclease